MPGPALKRALERALERALGAATVLALAAAPALAQNAPPPTGISEPGERFAPHAWGIGLQEAGGTIKEAIHGFNDLVLWIIIPITIFVFALLAYVVWRFRASVNPTPSRTSHHTYLEIAWTVVPVLILIVIAIPSFRLIYFQDRTRDADLTIGVQGRQWYWHYAYPDQGNFAFDSRPVPAEEIRGAQLRNLEVDEPLVVPVGKNIRVLTTGQDVIHSFFIPSLGVQRYTIPGRTIETWFRADHVGTFYGQCNQICGTNHWFMPIVVRAVPQEEFDAWVAGARQRFAAENAPLGAPANAVAAAPAAPSLPVAAAQGGNGQLIAELRR